MCTSGSSVCTFLTVAAFPAPTASPLSSPRLPSPEMGIRISQKRVIAITAANGEHSSSQFSYHGRRQVIRKTGKLDELLLQRENVVLTATRLCHPLSIK